MARRPRRRMTELTSLLDVLFTLIFAVLVESRRHGQAEAAAAAKAQAAPVVIPKVPMPPALPPDAGAAPPVGVGELALDAQRGQMRSAAARLMAGVRTQSTIVVGVSAAGEILTIDGAGRPEDLRIRLVRDSLDPARKIEYRGVTDEEDRVCSIVRRELGLKPDLARALVVITSDRPFAELSTALVLGLQKDATSCLDDANGFAVLLDPGKGEP